MFLTLLNKQQKNLFLNLAIKAAETNGVVEIEEKNMIKSFAMEMSIKPFYTTEEKLEDILKSLKDDSTKNELKIILFEIIGILYADSVLDEKEKSFLDKISTNFEIEPMQKEKMISLINQYAKLYTDICKEVL